LSSFVLDDPNSFPKIGLVVDFATAAQWQRASSMPANPAAKKRIFFGPSSCQKYHGMLLHEEFSPQQSRKLQF